MTFRTFGRPPREGAVRQGARHGFEVAEIALIEPDNIDVQHSLSLFFDGARARLEHLDRGHPFDTRKAHPTITVSPPRSGP